MKRLRHIALIYNPTAGPQRSRRSRQIESLLAELQRTGVEAWAVPTRAAGSAGNQAREAIAQGADVVFACGGDGTVHEVLQGMVNSSAALGVIPLGTANSLAADLGVPRRLNIAARILLQAVPTRVSLGKITYQDNPGKCASRYFTVTVGVGPDAHLFYALSQGAKQRFGYPAYFLKALTVWATHDYPLFEAEFTPSGAVSPRTEMVSQLLAVRITNFGGVLRRLAPGAALRRDDLRLVLFKTRSRWRYLQYMTSVLLGSEPRVRGVELLDAATVTCRLPRAAARPIRVEADGELLGRLPATVTIVPDALTLLMPAR